MYRRVMHYLFHRVRIFIYNILCGYIICRSLLPLPFPFSHVHVLLSSRHSQDPNVDLVVALDSATYNWSCENTSSGKYTLTLGIVYPCDLLTVIAKLSRIGNRFRLNWKGNISSSDGHKGIRGRKTRFLVCCPNTISTSMVLFWNTHMISMVPL